MTATAGAAGASDDSSDETVDGSGEGEQLHGWPVIASHGQRVVCCTRDGYLELMTALKEDGFEVDPPAKIHGSWTFYFLAPGGFVIEVLC